MRERSLIGRLSQFNSSENNIDLFSNPVLNVGLSCQQTNADCKGVGGGIVSRKVENEYVTVNFSLCQTS